MRLVYLITFYKNVTLLLTTPLSAVTGFLNSSRKLPTPFVPARLSRRQMIRLTRVVEIPADFDQ